MPNCRRVARPPSSTSPNQASEVPFGPGGDRPLCRFVEGERGEVPGRCEDRGGFVPGGRGSKQRKEERGERKGTSKGEERGGGSFESGGGGRSGALRARGLTVRLGAGMEGGDGQGVREVPARVRAPPAKGTTIRTAAKDRRPPLDPNPNPPPQTGPGRGPALARMRLYHEAMHNLDDSWKGTRFYQAPSTFVPTKAEELQCSLSPKKRRKRRREPRGVDGSFVFQGCSSLISPSTGSLRLYLRFWKFVVLFFCGTGSTLKGSRNV